MTREKSITWAGKTNKKFKDIAFKEEQGGWQIVKYITIYLYSTQIKNKREIGRTETHQKKKTKKMGLKPTRRRKKKQEEEGSKTQKKKKKEVGFFFFFFFSKSKIWYRPRLAGMAEIWPEVEWGVLWYRF